LPESLIPEDILPQINQPTGWPGANKEADQELVKLLAKLTSTNYAILSRLFELLSIIVSNSAVNKMTVQNLGIVFCPLLRLEAATFVKFVTKHEQFFKG